MDTIFATVAGLVAGLVFGLIGWATMEKTS